MECHLDHRTRFNPESEYKSLYSWSLQEVSETGEKIGSNQIPWPWSLYFSASELRYSRSLSIEEKGDSEDILPKHGGASSTESIYAVIHPGATTPDGDFERETIYSMFGTNRLINDFSLHIQPLEEEASDVCSAWGSVRYTSEIDFRSETVDDVLQISVGVSRKRFNELRDLVSQGRANDFVIRVGRVSGFYSAWSPSISTNRIKVLTRASEHTIEVPDGCEIEPPRLGEIGDFSLTATCRSRLKLKLDSDELGDVVEFVAPHEEDFLRPSRSQDALTERLAKNQSVFDGLKLPIWLIVVLLFLLYLK